MHIGILEDDELLANHLASVLHSAGHTSAIFNSARTFLPALNRNTFDLLVFDWRLPDQDGIKVLKHLRASFQGETPVIFLTAVHDEQAIVTALEAGADDYCVKPLRPAEFLARVAALQRRIYPTKQSVGPQTFNGYTFDPMTRVISWEGGQAQFSGKEFELARFLFENSDRSISRERLMQEVWGREDDPFSRTLDVHISRVRSRLGLGSLSPIRLRSVHGFGYQLITYAAPGQEE
ncbi:MAG: response regulator transcription factor [Betaproteobacteria bacterium]|nr:response regulator transcription factor [Betaproteobacteria bacterium]